MILLRFLHLISFLTSDLMPPSPPPLLFCFRSGIQTLPHNAKVHYNYANFLKDSGRYQEAMYHYTTALRSDSELKFSIVTQYVSEAVPCR